MSALDGIRAAHLARVLIAALVLAALVTNAVGAAHDGLLAQNVSYFTNQSNLLLVVLWAAAALPRERRPRWFDEMRGVIAFSLVMTGIIYALLVAPLDELLRWDIGWTGIVLHRLTPVAAAADWLLTPRRRIPSARRILWWQLYPMGFLVLTWLRGGITGWYPYEFLDPTASSWSQVLITTALVLVAFLAVAALVHLLEGRLRPRRATVDAAPGAGTTGAAAREAPRRGRRRAAARTLSRDLRRSAPRAARSPPSPRGSRLAPRRPRGGREPGRAPRPTGPGPEQGRRPWRAAAPRPRPGP